MTKDRVACTRVCKGCNTMNLNLIVPLHKMKETDFKKLGIDFWSSDFTDTFSNGT
jgi:hypothetical protein